MIRCYDFINRCQHYFLDDKFYLCRNELDDGDLLTFEHFDYLLQAFGNKSSENGEIAEVINKAANSSCKSVFFSLGPTLNVLSDDI